jgi:hypothetical protein
MTFFKVPTEADNGTAVTALINPQHVTLVATPDHRPDLCVIYLAGKRARYPETFRHISTTAPLEAVLKAFGPFVRVRKFQLITGNPWNVYYLRLAAIASVWPLGNGRADVTMSDGYELTIEDDDVLRSAGVEIKSL